MRKENYDKEIAIVYMVAGISSRFEGRIKQFAKVSDNEPLIEYSLKQALKSGFTKIVFIVGNKTEQPFKEKFGESYNGIPILYVLQKFNPEARNRPWGTGDALTCLKNVISCPFVLCNGDDIYGESAFKLLFEHLKNKNHEATLGYKLINVLPETGKTHRGIFKIDEKNYVKSLKETFNIEKSNLSITNNNPEDLCSMNIFALHPEIVEILSKELEKFKEKHKGDKDAEFLLPNEISKLIEKNQIQMKIYPCNEKWLGITNPGDEIKVREELEKQNKKSS